MPNASRNPHALRHVAANAVLQLASAATPSIEAQCRAVVSRLDEITAPRMAGESSAFDRDVDAGALHCLPDPTDWGGRAIMPWGHPRCGGELSRDVRPVRAGQTGWYLQYDGQMFDTVRDVFIAARMHKQITTPWTKPTPSRACGCFTRGMTRHVVAEGMVNVDA